MGEQLKEGMGASYFDAYFMQLKEEATFSDFNPKVCHSHNVLGSECSIFISMFSLNILLWYSELHQA